MRFLPVLTIKLHGRDSFLPVFPAKIGFNHTFQNTDDSITPLPPLPGCLGAMEQVAERG